MTEKPIVTDHAVVRYLERVEGLDVEKYRNMIAKKVDLGIRCGAIAVRKDGFRYVLKNGHVVTVTGK